MSDSIINIRILDWHFKLLKTYRPQISKTITTAPIIGEMVSSKYMNSLDIQTSNNKHGH